MDTVKQLLYNMGTSSFLGCGMQQCWTDLAVWEKFFLSHKIHSLIELGTGYCGMSTFLLLQCIQRKMQFLTFDIRRLANLHRPLSEFIGLEDHFVEADIFTNSDLVESAIETLRKPLLLFCDNGDKPKEFRTFVPLLEQGDYVAVHDWLSEIGENDVKGFSIEPVMREECEAWSSATRFWRII